MVVWLWKPIKRRPVVQQAINRLKNVNANTWWCREQFDSNRSGYGYYYYYADYGYYQEDDVDTQKLAKMTPCSEITLVWILWSGNTI